MGDFDDGFIDRTDSFKTEHVASPTVGVDDTEIMKRLMDLLKEQKALLGAQDRLKAIGPEIIRLSEELGLPVAKPRERSPRGEAVKAEDIVAKINELAPYDSGKDVTAKDLNAHFPGRNITSALAKIKRDGLVQVTARGPKAGGNLYRSIQLKKSGAEPSGKKR